MAGMSARSAAAALLFLAACAEERPPSPGPSPLGPPEPWFTEEAAARGITLLNRTGRPRRKELLLESVGPGAAVLDANADGLLDIYIPNGGMLEGPLREDLHEGEDRPRDALYIQRPDGTFADEAKARGVDDDAWSFGACAADLDNDGDEDLVVSNLGPNRLYANDGTGHFTDIAAEARVAGPSGRREREWSTGIAAGDFDRDGILDLYIANYADIFRWVRESPDVKRGPDGTILKLNTCRWQRLEVYCGPIGLPAQQDRLYRGSAGGTARCGSRT
jgi:hypothetical protein